MKTRQIQTRFWDDEFVANATWQARNVFIYIISSPYINICSIFQLSDKKIILETGLSLEDFEIGKEELEKNKKILFYKGWIYVVNAFKNNRYWISSKCWDAWEMEFSRINKETLEHFGKILDTDIYTDQYTEISNQKIIARSKKQTASKKKMMAEKETDDLVDWVDEKIN